jgi:GNAT superfamily N-acetyltransferase
MAVKMRAVMPALEITRFAREHLPGVIALFAAERWSYAEDPERTWRALKRPGSLVLVAVHGDEVVGVAHVLGDGEIQAFLSILLVSEEHRREGVGRRLVHEAMARTRGLRLDAISCADPFYDALGFRRVSGFRAALDLSRST